MFVSAKAKKRAKLRGKELIIPIGVVVQFVGRLVDERDSFATKMLLLVLGLVVYGGSRQPSLFS